MNYFRKCCSRIIRQVRISRKAKRHVVRRHFLPKATGRVSVFSHKLSPNDVFQTTLNKLRSRQLQGKIHYKRCPRSSWNSNLSRVEGSNVFQEFEEASQKAISTKDYNIYCLSAPWHGSVSTFELTRKFVSCYFFGMTVKFLEEIAVTKVNCKQRFHPDTGKL